MASNTKEYNNSWYENNKAARIEQIKKDKQRKMLYIREFKESRGCMDCGQSFPYYVLDLDHRDPSIKLINPGQMVTVGWGLEKIKAEIAKCDVVCSNCHRVRTHSSAGLAQK